jgi:ribulose-5-phosphate 4-epimerase/fuculose-1-phosphate aldolase
VTRIGDGGAIENGDILNAMKIGVVYPAAASAVLATVILIGQPQKAFPAGQATNLALVEELVLANHMLANEGVLDGYGHVSMRDPGNPSHFLLARHLAAAVVTASDVILYDLDGKPLKTQSGVVGYTERFIHSEIYRTRPDVNAIVHSHAPDIVPFTVSSVKLRPLSHMAGFLEDGVPVFEIRDTGGMTDMLIRTPTLGKALAQTLGSRPAALLRGHGAVITGPSLHVVVGRAYYMVFNAHAQLQAVSLGGSIKFLDPEEARKSAAQDGFERAWDSFRRKLGDR